MRLKKSKNMFEEARPIIPGGVHSGFRYTEPHPRYFSHAKGSKVWDVDGNEYIDCLVNMGACILGHGHPAIIESVKQQLDKGLTVGLESELSITVAKLLSSIIPSGEMVKFSNTGTEAVMHAIQIARGYTGKNKIMKLEGGYNGWYDFVRVSTHPDLDKAGPESNPNPIPMSGGLAQEVVKHTLLMPFNNIQIAENLIKKNKDELSCVIMEPVMFNAGCITPEPGYLDAIREITVKNDIILIFDEVISGFRLAPGGAQEYYQVTPDLSTFGKALANGIPLAAVTGKRDVMEVTDPKKGKVKYSGTYNANQPGLAAAKVALEEFKTGKVQKALNQNTEKIKDDFKEAAFDVGVEAHIQGVGGEFQWYFTKKEELHNYRDVVINCSQDQFMTFEEKMIDLGILAWPAYILHHGITAAHTKEDLDKIAERTYIALKEVKKIH